MNIRRYLSVAVILLGLAAIVIGGVFIGVGMSKDNLLKTDMRAEQITLGIESAAIGAEEYIDSANEAQIAGDTVREHRHSISPTYGDLLGDGRYDPTNPSHLTYAQAMNLENYLYLAVLGFGVTQLAMGTGAFMILAGAGLGITGFLLLRGNRA